MARKSYADALEFYLRALKATDNKDARLWNKVGIARQNLLDMSGARKAYKQAIRFKKDFAEPYNNVGTTYYLSDQAKKSLKWYRQAIQHNPGNPAFHYNLGTALYARKKIKEAIEAYQQTLRLDPGFFTNRSNVGTTLQARPADAKYFFYLAKVFASLGRPEEAVRYLRRALEDGFKDFEMIDQDPDFKTMAQYPPYLELRATPPPTSLTACSLMWAARGSRKTASNSAGWASAIMSRGPTHEQTACRFPGVLRRARTQCSAAFSHDSGAPV